MLNSCCVLCSPVVLMGWMLNRFLPLVAVCWANSAAETEGVMGLLKAAPFCCFGIVVKCIKNTCVFLCEVRHNGAVQV